MVESLGRENGAEPILGGRCTKKENCDMVNAREFQGVSLSRRVRIGGGKVWLVLEFGAGG